MKKKFKSLLLLMSLVMLIGILAACGGAKEKENTATTDANYAEKVTENPIVTITLENDQEISLELQPKVAPNTVANFVHLVQDGFYDGLIFHRVIPDFMIQGGSSTGDGMGGADFSIKGEFASNGFKNDLLHERGVLSMARSGEPNSASTQFFIMVEKADSLDGDYAAFGKVIEGMEAVDAIVNEKRDAADKPLKDQIMKKVVVDTKGFDYPKPELIK